MPRNDGNLVLYAVDLDDLRAWVGGGEARRKEALREIGNDPEAGWSGELRPVLERLLQRVVGEGALYAGLEEADRYYLTQVLIDLFDEYVDAEPVSEELPLDRLLREAAALPPGTPGARGLAHLLRGRELDGDGLLWAAGPWERARPYLGFVRRDEAAAAAESIAAHLKRASGPRGRPSGLWKPVLAALRECAETEFDLISFVG